MGGLARLLALERFLREFKKTLEDYFQKIKGLQIVEMGEVKVDYYVKSNIKLSNGETYPVHYRWSSGLEDLEGKELEENYIPMKEYYKKYILKTEIIDLKVGISENKDDEAYLFLITENGGIAEVPLGFDPESEEIFGLAKEILDSKIIQSFHEKIHSIVL